MTQDRIANWGESDSAARSQTGDTDPDGGDFIVVRDLTGGGQLLLWDYTVGEWKYGGPVNLQGNDITNAGTVSANTLTADEIPVDGQMEVDGQNTGGYVFGQGGPLEVNKRSVFLQGKSSGHLRIRNEDFDGEGNGASYIYQTRETDLDDRHELRENVRGKRMFRIFPDSVFEFPEVPVSITANSTGEPMFEVLDEGNARGIRVNEFGTGVELERPGSTFRIEGVDDTRVRVDVNGNRMLTLTEDGVVRARDEDGNMRKLDGNGDWVQI